MFRYYSFDILFQLSFLSITNNLANLEPTAEELDIRYDTNSVPRSKIDFVINIHREDLFIWEFIRYLLEDWGQLTSRRTPGRPKIDCDNIIFRQNQLIPFGFLYFLYGHCISSCSVLRNTL